MRFEDIIIDEEFEAEIPKMSGQEFKQLEENILRVAEVTESLKVWNKTLIDGHNRYQIIKKHPALKYTIKKMYFDDREQAKLWICKNQLGRRNLTKEQRTFLIGKQYELEKTARGGLKANGHDAEGKFTATHHFDGTRHNDQTSERIARENNTSKATVERAGCYARGLEEADKVEPGIKDKVLNGELKVTQKQVMDIAKADDSDKVLRIQGLAPIRKKKFTEEEKRHIEVLREMANPDRVTEISLEEELEYLHVRMATPLEDLEFLWSSVGEEFGSLLQNKEAQNDIKELAYKGIAFLEKIIAGELWNSEEE